MAEELGPLWVFYEEEWLGRVVARGEESGVVSSSTFRDPTNSLKWSVQVTWGQGTNRKYDEDILCDDVRPLLLNRFVNDPKLVHRKVLKLQNANWADASFAEDIRVSTDAALKRMDEAPRNRIYPENGPPGGLLLPQRPVVLPQNQGLMRLVHAAGPRAAPASPSQTPAGSSQPGEARGSKRARADHEEAGGLSTLAEAAAAVRSPVQSPAKGGNAAAGRAASGASRGAGAKGANPPPAKRQAGEQAAAKEQVAAKKQAAKTKATAGAAAKAVATSNAAKSAEPATPATSADSGSAAASSESFQSLESAGKPPDYKDTSEWVKGWTGTYYPKSVLNRPADLPVGTAEGDDDEEYEIETLVDEFKDKKEIYVLVKWVGWACDVGKGRKQVINGKGAGHWMPLKQWAKEQEGVLELYNEWRKDKPEWYKRQMV